MQIYHPQNAWATHAPLPHLLSYPPSSPGYESDIEPSSPSGWSNQQATSPYSPPWQPEPTFPAPLGQSPVRRTSRGNTRPSRHYAEPLLPDLYPFDYSPQPPTREQQQPWAPPPALSAFGSRSQSPGSEVPAYRSRSRDRGGRYERSPWVHVLNHTVSHMQNTEQEVRGRRRRAAEVVYRPQSQQEYTSSPRNYQSYPRGVEVERTDDGCGNGVYALRRFVDAESEEDPVVVETRRRRGGRGRR